VTDGNADWALRLCNALFLYWQERELLPEGRQALAAVLALPAAAAPTRERARALYHLSVLMTIQGERANAEPGQREAQYAAALPLLRGAHGIYTRLGDTNGVAMTLMALAWHAQHSGQFDQAMALLEEAAALWEGPDQMAPADFARTNMASVAKAEGRHDLARTILERLVEASARRHDTRGEAMALRGLGDLAASRGHDDLARSHHQESLAAFRRVDDRSGMAAVLTDQADLDLRAGKYEAARVSLTEALRIEPTYQPAAAKTPSVKRCRKT
jgi:tetratricopeptide (TPR) repeat protein